MSLKAVQITNPNWLAYLGKEIEDLCGKVNIPGVIPQTLMSYFISCVQTRVGEFWVVISGDETGGDPDNPMKVHAFAHWHLCGLPHVGKAYLTWIYSWNRAKEPTKLLIKEFIDFGKRNRCTFYMGDVSTEAHMRLFKSLWERKFKGTVSRADTIKFIGRVG